MPLLGCAVYSRAGARKSLQEHGFSTGSGRKHPTTRRDVGRKPSATVQPRRINDCHIVAFRSAKVRDFRGAKGDSKYFVEHRAFAHGAA